MLNFDMLKKELNHIYFYLKKELRHIYFLLFKKEKRYISAKDKSIINIRTNYSDIIFNDLRKKIKIKIYILRKKC